MEQDLFWFRVYWSWIGCDSYLWSVLLLSAYTFYQVDQYAGLLLVPTCLWVTVATALNWSIFALSKDETRG